ncbi:hypothetical protein ABPG75_011028 [Micractinium tetrahymenae]
MDVDDEAVARFMSAAHCDAEQAQFFLEACGGNHDRALHMFLEQTAGDHGARRPHPPDVPLRPRAPRGGGGAVNAYPAGAGGALPPPLALLGAVLGAPLALLGGGGRLVMRALGWGAALVGAVARRVLPARVSAALAGAGHALVAAGEEVPPAQAAAEFVRQFAERFGDRRPRWQECGWAEAASRAHAEAKFLFVYLHSPQHEDTEGYCRDTLCSPGFVQNVNQTFLCWGGDVQRSDAFRLASSLHVARYPYAALLAFSGPRTRLITCVEGRMGPEQLQEVLAAGVSDHGALLWQEQLERQQRETDRRLREEQDAEYQRSLEADRQREEQRAAAARAAEEAERAAREAAERARAEAEAAERQRAEQEAALQRRKSEKRMALPEEPAAGTPGTTLLRVRLPDGSTHQRRFMASDPLQVVHDFVDSLEAVSALNYSLATTFPRRVYAAESLGQSLQELDLVPQAALLMQPEDD